MNVDTLLYFGREALLLVCLVSLPPLGASLVIGLLVSAIQAMTQIQEQTLTFVPRLAGAIGALVIAAPWIGHELRTLAAHVFALIAEVGR